MGASSSRHLSNASLIDGGIYEILPRGYPEHCVSLDRQHREVQLVPRNHGNCPAQRFIVHRRKYQNHTVWTIESEAEPGLVMKLEPTSLTEKSYRLCMRTFHHDDMTTNLERESALFTIECDAKLQKQSATAKRQGHTDDESAAATIIRCCAEPSCFFAIAADDVSSATSGDTSAVVAMTMPTVIIASPSDKIKKFQDISLAMQFDFVHIPLRHDGAYELVPRHALHLRVEAVATPDHHTLQLARHNNSRSQRFVARQRPDFSWAISPCTNGAEEGETIVTDLAVSESNNPFTHDVMEHPVVIEQLDSTDPRQGFVVRMLDRGFAELVNMHSGRVLDCFKAGAAPGTHVYTTARHSSEGHAHQQFELRPATQALATTPSAALPVSPSANIEPATSPLPRLDAKQVYHSEFTYQQHPAHDSVAVSNASIPSRSPADTTTTKFFSASG
jgi:hypothetical protein